tara:strand:- start:40 stop:1263 length:1224 start_codon:yes stop_codon:yes gene_type:complete
MKKIKIVERKINRETKLFANPNDFIPNPLNKKIYANKEQELKTQEKIAKDMRERNERGVVPNKDAIIIWPDGLLEAGHTRTAAAKLSATNEVWITMSEEDYPDPKKPYSNFVTTTSSNIYRDMKPSVKLNEFIVAEKAYIEEYDMARPAKERDSHIKGLGTSKGTLDKLTEIKKSPNGKDLLKRVDSGDMSVKSAHDEATGKNKVKVITSNNLDRDWIEIYTDDVFNIAFNRMSNMINSTLELSTKIDGEDYEPYQDFTDGAKSTIISHLCEMIISKVLVSEGHDVVAATGHPTDPDIYHRDIDDRIEIKVAKFEGANTNWKGGKGIREGQYVLITYDETATHWCVIFTTLTREDWERTGGGIMSGHKLPIKNVFKNHSDDKKNYKVVYGDVKKLNGKINVNMENIK